MNKETMRLLSKILLTVLSFLLILAVFWFSLPRIIESYTYSRLSQLGYRDIGFVVGDVGFRSATIEHLRMSNDDFSIELRDVQAEYRLSDLLSGSVDTLVLRQAELKQRVNKKDKVAVVLPDPLLLLAMLSTPWKEYLPANSLSINNLHVFDDKGELLVRSSIEIAKEEDVLSAKINLIDSKDENHLLVLEASDDKGIFVQVRSEAAAEDQVSPLSINLRRADGLDGLSGQINIDFSKLPWDLAGIDSMNGQMQAEVSYLSPTNEAIKVFSVAAELTDVKYESWQLKNSSINIQGKIGKQDDAYRIEFNESSSILAQSIKQGSNEIEQVFIVLPQILEIGTEKMVVPSQSGATISLKNLVWDGIDIPQIKLKDIAFSSKGSMKEPLSCNYKLLLLAPKISRAGLKFTTLPVKLDGACNESENGSWLIRADTESLIVEDEDFIFPLSQCHAELQSLAIKDNTQTGSAEFSGNLSCESSKQSSAVLSTFQFSPETGAGHAKYSISDISPNDELPLFGSLLKNWKEPYDMVTGSLSVNGRYRWWKNQKGQDRENLLVNFNIKDGGGYYDSVLFSGLDYNDQIEVLPYVTSSAFTDLTISDIDVGIPITSTKASILYSKSAKGHLPLVTINSFSTSLLDGKVLGNDLEIDLNNTEHELTLVVSGLDISEIADLQQIEGLSVTGRLGGYVPVTITEKGLKITEGKIVAQQQGGQIHYRPEGGTLEMEESALGSEFVFRIIEDLKYDSLNIDVNYQENGDLDMNLSIKGKSPKVDEDRPVHFNLNLQQNVLKLLEGLRYAEGLSDEIDKNVQRHFNGGKLK
ncbi:MAG: YdbH domain-containing protein [Gammaproteobacteria bacterium]|nr:YdbH domain-containing protein [Gammaproteobacteria bacterium]